MMAILVLQACQEHPRHIRHFTLQEMGGLTFTAVQLPMVTVTELPKTRHKNTVLHWMNYSYCEMPEKEGDIFTIRVLSAAGELDAILFESKDNGETWTYVGS